MLGASNYIYSEATWTQGLADCIGVHMRAFEFSLKAAAPGALLAEDPELAWV